MAIASKITACDPTPSVAPAWMEIEDDDGKRWRYVNRGNAPSSATIHVRGDQGRLTLVRGNDGKAILKQDGPGLLRNINVQFSSPAGPGAMGVVGSWTGGGGTYEYEME